MNHYLQYRFITRTYNYAWIHFLNNLCFLFCSRSVEFNQEELPIQTDMLTFPHATGANESLQDAVDEVTVFLLVKILSRGVHAMELNLDIHQNNKINFLYVLN